MIEYLSGKIIHMSASGAIVDVQGVGYGFEAALTTLSQLPGVGQKADIWVYTHVREDALRLFGFVSYEQKQLFGFLLGLSGVGPKVALAMVSSLGCEGLEQAIYQDDGALLQQVPGVGKRLAEKILLEWRGKLKKYTAMREGVPSQVCQDLSPSDLKKSEYWGDLQSALENLGYKDKSIKPVLQKLQADNEVLDFQVVIRKALQELAVPLN